MLKDSSYFSSRYFGRWIFLIFYLIFFLFVLNLFFSSNSTEVQNQILTEEINEKNLKEKVLIYAATKFFNHPITTERFLAQCPQKMSYCQISENFQNYEKADAVVFHNADYLQNQNLELISEKRNPKVPFVLWSLESPSNDFFRPKPYFINWTMTYRKDAEIFSPYGKIEKNEKKIDVDLEKLWNMKTKSATILASNCNAKNKRLKIIQKLINSGVKIDIWGGCGKKPTNCEGVDKQEADCVLNLIKQYKFYISIENSNCKHYVTEKFWKALGERMAIPIVLSRKYYKELDVPDSAYIAIDDFDSISDAAKHINRVENDKKLYLSYHEWRQNYRIQIYGGFNGFCQLCDFVRNENYVKSHMKSYSNVAEWHSRDACDNLIADKFL